MQPSLTQSNWGSILIEPSQYFIKIFWSLPVIPTYTLAYNCPSSDELDIFNTIHRAHLFLESLVESAAIIAAMPVEAAISTGVKTTISQFLVPIEEHYLWVGAEKGVSLFKNVICVAVVRCHRCINVND